MAGYNKFDARIESLVIETRTHWDPEVGELSDQDKTWLARVIHQNPAAATQIGYVRAHTGFTREITVTLADIQRLYQEKMVRA
jgi:hypothetical protein